MVYLKLIEGNYQNKDAIENTIQYICKPEHAISGLIGGINVTAESNLAIKQFYSVKRFFHKLDGRQVWHFIISFEKRTNKYDILRYGYKIAEHFSNKYQIIFAVHENEPNIHIHFVMNSVSFVDGKKYNDWYKDYIDLYKKV